MRFDEIELAAVPLVVEDHVPVSETNASGATRSRRLLALITDLSLFAALVLALSPLLPDVSGWIHLTALAGFVVILSYYYFVGMWMLWGKTIGGAIFDVRVIAGGTEAMSLRDASVRWAAVYLSILTCGLGFALAALPAQMSLPDRLSNTRCV